MHQILNTPSVFVIYVLEISVRNV